VPRQDLPRARALKGEHRVVGRHVVDGHVEAGRVRCDPGVVALMIRRVRDREEAIPEAVGEEVVEHAAVVATEQRVLGSLRGDPRDVVRQQVLEEDLSVRAARLHLAHVRDVEEAG
jgi:hypothetical protein